MMLRPGELYRIKERTEYDFDNNQWRVPLFYLRDKQVELPKI